MGLLMQLMNLVLITKCFPLFTKYREPCNTGAECCEASGSDCKIDASEVAMTAEHEITLAISEIIDGARIKDGKLPKSLSNSLDSLESELVEGIQSEIDEKISESRQSVHKNLKLFQNRLGAVIEEFKNDIDNKIISVARTSASRVPISPPVETVPTSNEGNEDPSVISGSANSDSPTASSFTGHLNAAGALQGLFFNPSIVGTALDYSYLPSPVLKLIGLIHDTIDRFREKTSGLTAILNKSINASYGNLHDSIDNILFFTSEHSSELRKSVIDDIVERNQSNVDKLEAELKEKLPAKTYEVINNALSASLCDSNQYRSSNTFQRTNAYSALFQ